MLPDFLQSKREYFKLLQTQFNQRKAQALGIFAEIRETPMHEGDQAILVRSDGREEETKFEKISVEYKLSFEDEEKMSDDELLAKFLGMADEMAMRQSQLTLTAIDEAVSKVGNIVSTKELGPQAVLDGLEKMHIPFRPDGKHDDLPFVSGPAMQTRMREIFDLLANHPVWSKKYKEVMLRKREEWNARESTRKLAG